MDPPRVVLVLFNLPCKISGLLFALLNLSQNAIEISRDLVDPMYNDNYLFSRLVILLISMSI